MNKNIQILKLFMAIMMGKNEEKESVIPNNYVADVYNIDYKMLYSKGYTNLIFDIDNTLLPVNKLEVPNKLVKLFDELKKMGFNICIVSNNGNWRVEKPAKELGVKYLAKAKKPTRVGFDKALNILKSNKKNTIMIGDQMLTDIRGANQYGLYTVMVDPVERKYDIPTGTQRCFQNTIVKKLRKEGRFNYGKYY